MTLNQGETARTPLDLNALEKWIEHELESYSTRTNTFRLDEMRQVIAELRTARAAVEAAREWLEDWRGPAERGAELELHGEPPAAYVFVAALATYDRLTTSEDKG